MSAPAERGALRKRLLQALKRPVTYAILLIGAYVAVHRLPIQDAWTAGLDDAIFTIAVALVGLAALRVYGVLLAWYATESPLSAETGVTREFGPLLNRLGSIFVLVVATIAILQHFTVLIIPNSVLVKDRVVNQSRPSRHLTTRLDVGVAYGTDLAMVKRVLVEAALASERVDGDRQPVAVVTRFGDMVIQCRLVFWARDYTEQGLALSDVHEEVYRRFREAGIEMPLLVRRLVQEEARPA